MVLGSAPMRAAKLLTRLAAQSQNDTDAPAPASISPITIRLAALSSITSTRVPAKRDSAAASSSPPSGHLSGR